MKNLFIKYQLELRNVHCWEQKAKPKGGLKKGNQDIDKTSRREICVSLPS